MTDEDKPLEHPDDNAERQRQRGANAPRQGSLLRDGDRWVVLLDGEEQFFDTAETGRAFLYDTFSKNWPNQFRVVRGAEFWCGQDRETADTSREKIIEQAAKMIARKPSPIDRQAELELERCGIKPLDGLARLEEARRVARVDVTAELNRIDGEREALQRLRSRASKETVRAVGQLDAALRRARIALPKDLISILAINQTIWMLEAYEKHLGTSVTIEPGKDGTVKAIPKPRRPRRSAIDKRLAARAALRLCETYNINLTSTKTGRFCKLAAVLYGDPRADLQHHVREVLAEHKSGARRRP